MKKVTIALVVVLLLGGVLLAGLSPWGMRFLGWKWVWSKDLALLEEQAWKFLEDLKYKDFSKAAGYHNFADRKKADIPKLIERLFAIKPEQLDLRDYKITGVDLDEDGMRARTHFHATYVVLNSARGEDGKNEEREMEGILYWHRRPASEDLAPPADGAAPATPAVVSTAPAGPDGAPGEAQKWFMKLESSLH